ncbi:hypothetical protein TNCV_3356851 [Trichonephila clavipes]|nr:hypothetical protein TNCV_3356851 [Trichonephila clavipes]
MSNFKAIIIKYLLDAIHHMFPEFLGKSTQQLLLGLIFTGVIYSFILFNPLAYGIDSSSGTQASIMKLKWLDTWEF